MKLTKYKTFIFICLFLICATFISYIQVLNHGYISYDDGIYITENPHVQQGLTVESFKWAFTKIYISTWHPITWLSHMLDIELYGINNPSGHHLTSLLFHIANTLLLFGVLFKMTRALWRSAIVATLFALHPLNVESVAWIAERKNVLSTTFWFLTLWAYTDYMKNKTVKSYLLIVLFLALGLMSKPMLVTLPFVLLLLDFWPLKRWGWQGLVLEKIPLFALIIVSSIITYVGQAKGVIQSDPLNPIYTKVSNALVSYVDYLGKIIWPHNLTIFYPHPGNALPVWKTIVCGSLLIGITFYMIKKARDMPYMIIGWLWYLGTLVPVIGLVRVGSFAMADRYMYIPMIGIFIAIVWGLSELIRSEKLNAIIGLPIILVLMALTWQYVGYWKDSAILFKRAVYLSKKQYKSSVGAYHGTVVELLKQQKIEEAIYYIREGLKVNGNYVPLIRGLGILLEQKGNWKEAEVHYRKVNKLEQNSFENNFRLADILYKLNKLKEANTYYKIAVSLDNKSAIAHSNLGSTFLDLKQFNKAEESFKNAIKYNKKLFRSYYGLGIIYRHSGQYSKAIEAFKQALVLNPNSKQARLNLKEIINKNKIAPLNF